MGASSTHALIALCGQLLCRLTYHFAISLRASSRCACSDGPECCAGSEDMFLIPFTLLCCRRAKCLRACRAACMLRNRSLPVSDNKQVSTKILHIMLVPGTLLRFQNAVMLPSLSLTATCCGNDRCHASFVTFTEGRMSISRNHMHTLMATLTSHKVWVTHVVTTRCARCAPCHWTCFQGFKYVAGMESSYTAFAACV